MLEGPADLARVSINTAREANDIADDREGQRYLAAGTKPLAPAGSDELAYLGRHADQRRADQEHEDSKTEYRLAAVEVGDLAV